jgi:hypothetical protein
MKKGAMENRSRDGRRGEGGFALVLAILSLMLLTFLGLTMAATTSTELQIATNYRWSQQALYNAEAGLEAARVILANTGGTGTGWQGILPTARTTPWQLGTAPPPGGTSEGRDYERADCDQRAGVGYGLVLADTARRYENISSFQDTTLNGAFTLWVRRALEPQTDGTYVDDDNNERLIVVSEGVAPYTGAMKGEVLSGAASALIRSRQAVRILETRLTLGTATTGKPCGLGAGRGQEGGSAMGENFNPCVNITAGPTGTLAGVFGGGADAGQLTSNQSVQ